MSALRTTVPFLALTLLFATACPPPDTGDGGTDGATDASTDAPVAPRAECNPVGFPESCMLPYPSTFYLREESTSPTGFRVAFPPLALPATRGALAGAATGRIDPAPWNRLDGFSPAAPLLAYFRERIDAATLVKPSQMERSVLATSPTFIVDLESNELVPHFSEVDVTARTTTRQAVILRPAVRLTAGHRYAAVIMRSVRSVEAMEPTAPPGFAALRDGMAMRDARLAPLVAPYETLFTKLSQAGIARADTLLAWEFVTASEEHLTGPVVAMRDQALAVAQGEALRVTVTSVEEDFNARILRRVRGTFRAPMFLTDDTPEGVMRRDAQGRPVMMGTHEVPFVAMVPRRASTERPLPLVLFGHGIFGSAERELGTAESTGNYMQRFAEERGVILVATNWTGLTDTDLALAFGGLQNINVLPRVTDKLQQALVNAMVLFRTARDRFGMESAFQTAGTSVIDPARAYYYGISLGGIMGTSFTGYFPECERSVLNVAGGNWSLLFQRNDGWNALALALTEYPQFDDRQVLLAMAQSLFDTSDPINVAPHMFRDRLPGVPERRVLLQEAVGDSAVNNLATEMVARTMGIPLLSPSVRTPYGLVPTEGPLPSAFTIWDQMPSPLPPETNETRRMNDTHTTLRALAALNEQIYRFLRPAGQVEQTCNGVCDPE